MLRTVEAVVSHNPRLELCESKRLTHVSPQKEIEGVTIELDFEA
jgi:hypothetical protein